MSSVSLNGLFQGSKNKCYLDGKEANIESGDASPIFYLHVGEPGTTEGAGTSGGQGGTAYFDQVTTSAMSSGGGYQFPGHDRGEGSCNL